jgi:hypothetical protein
MTSMIARLSDTGARPDALARPLLALWHLRAGGLAMGEHWMAAHALCQEQEGDPDHDIVHALAHLIEGDAPNAAYWYRRAGSRQTGDIEAEWQRIATLLSERLAPDRSGGS